MERISGYNNWKLVVRRTEEEVTVLWAATCDKRASLPEELFGLPVTVLGDHALTPRRTPPEGEEVLITCGVPDGVEWDNSALEELILPETLRRVDNYGLFNCTRLKTLRLHDTLFQWGGGALMNCRVLDTFHITCSGKEGELLAYLADELTRELDVTLYRGNGTVRLLFPEYTEVYEENVPHHQFDFRIQGAGYSYHHCFYQKKFSLRDYDGLWKPYLAMGHEADCALRLAWWRLRYPVELTDQAEADYWAYLRGHAVEAAHWRLSERDADGLAFLFARTDWDRGALTALCDLARSREETELLALLLEEQHRRFGAGPKKSFAL